MRKLTKLEKRAIALAEKHNLSAQLTGYWLERNDEKDPLTPLALRALIAWARVPETNL